MTDRTAAGSVRPSRSTTRRPPPPRRAPPLLDEAVDSLRPDGRGELGALIAIGVLAVFGACWRLSTADWKIDESLDGALAWESVRHGRWDLSDGHPVAVRWFLAAGQEVFGQNRAGIRAAGAVAAVLAVGLLYVAGTRLHSRTAGLVAAGLWAVLPRALVLGHTTVGPLRGDRFGYLEPFMVVFLLGATITAMAWIRRGRLLDAVWTGLLVGAATAFKPTAVVVVVPIVAVAVWSRRSLRPVLAGAAVIAVLAAIVLPISYLPLGTAGPAALRELIDYQLDHARSGHFLVVDGQLTDHQPRTAHLLYQWRGMGWAACTGLLIGIAGAWVGRRRVGVVLVAALWLALVGFHLLSSVALPHYYLLWAPFSALLAAMGLVELARLGDPAPDRPTVDRWPRRMTERFDRAPGPTAGVAVAGLLLLGSGLAASWSTASLQGGAYAQMAAELDARGVEPATVRYQGEAVDRYFPGAVSGQIGFTSAGAPFDLLVLDPRDLPMLAAGAADEARAQASANGLVAHRIDRLEVWYAEPG